MAFVEANEYRLPPDTSSPEADEGTRAHAYADALFKGEPGTPDNAEMDRVVKDYVEWVKRDIRPGDTFWTERRVPLFYFPEDGGTVDATIWASDRIIVRDLKYGKGVSVDAVNNKQLAIYAESIIRLIELIEEVHEWVPVTMEIYQPRDRNNPEPVRSWTITRGELKRFCWKIQGASDLITSGECLEFVPEPDTVCRWCRAKGICKAYADYGTRDLVDLDASPQPAIETRLSPPDPKSLTREQRIKIIGARKAMEKWLEAVEAQEVAELLAGSPPMGLKLVEGKSNRQWSDEAAAEKLLRNHFLLDQVRPPGDLISPAAAETLLKGLEVSAKFQNKFDTLITKPSGKPTLVPESDKRPALNLNPKNQLENLDYEFV